MALARTGQARGSCGDDETRDRFTQHSSHGAEREPFTTTRRAEQKLETTTWPAHATLALCRGGGRGRDAASDARLRARKSCS
jgi:hypothetical protein